MSATPQADGGVSRHDGALSRLARACARHGWRTIAVWVIAVAAIAGASQTLGGPLVNEFTIPDSEAQQATDLLADRFPARSGDSAQIVFALDRGRLDAGGSRAAVATALEAAADTEGVTSVGDPFAGQAGAVSDDGRIAYADIQFALPGAEVDTAVVEGLEQRARAAGEAAGVQVEFGGPVIAAAEQAGPSSAELIGLAAAVVILVIALGSVVAMGVPILLALLSVGVGLLFITLAAGVTNFNTITPTLATMIGLGVGIDYALFVVTRFRQALHDGASAEDAAAIATATAGRAVIFAGVTVAISISALAVIGLDFITKMGLGAAITVASAVAAAVTLLPAVLSLLGHRIDSGRVPFVKASDASEAAREGTLVARLGRFVTRHPWWVGGVATLVLVVLALPVLNVRLGSSDAGSNATDTTTRQAYDLLSEGFGPGVNGPLLVAVDQAAAPDAAETLAAELRSTEGVASVSPPAPNESGDTAVITVFPTTSPQAEETKQLVDRLRSEVVPETLGASGAAAYVGGQTAAFEDIAARLTDRLPIFLVAVIGIIFLLITMAFRSVVVAAKAAITTLLSAAAAFGILVAVFQEGWGASLIGLDSTGPIESFLPAIVFAILFGLATDYEVFLVSRIREQYVGGDSAERAITHGIAAIGRVVIAAALIMGSVFFSFLLGGERTIMMFGLGLGSAILIDAFIVRLLIVPAVMQILGDKAWYMPRWLDRILPDLTIEPPTSAPEGPAPAPSDGRPVGATAMSARSEVPVDRAGSAGRDEGGRGG